MKKIISAVLLLIVFVTSCQKQEAATPVSVFPSETPIPATVDLSTQTPTPIICETKPPLVELSTLPEIPDGNLPVPRNYATMAYDQRREVIVLFGGEKNPITWEYNGLEWKQVTTTTSPPARSFYPAMAYDSKREVIMMYGGWDNTGKNLYDVWEYDGGNWREIILENTPEKLRFPVMTYHPLWEKIILFGEYRDSATYQTWTYDGASWKNLNQDLPDIPMPSMFYQTVYDSCHQKLYLQMLSNWTYEFDGNQWHVIYEGKQPHMPIPHLNTVYDARRGVVVLYGTRLPGDWKSETWEFDGVDWQQVQPLASPPPRSGHAMVFDERRGVTVMFGGKTQDGVLLNDLWEYDGTTWVQR